ncbi:MAG: hypothetical protein SFX73_26965 [Kofleriaceae bacterium]|nr:hypothetical protein [Kofleriaceae bacterium]
MRRPHLGSLGQCVPLAVLVTVAACGRYDFEPLDGGGTDAPLEAVPSCETWGPPSVLANLNSVAEDWGPSLSPDGRALVFSSTRNSMRALYLSRWSAQGWMSPVPISILNALAGSEDGPAWSPDGRELYFQNDSTGQFQIWVSAYDPSTGAFSTPMKAPGLEATAAIAPFVRADDLELMLTDIAQGDLLRSTRSSPTDAWGPPMPIAELNTGVMEGFSTLSPDGLTIYIEFHMGAVLDIGRASRPALDQPFGAVSRVGELSSPSEDGDPDVSRDGRTLVMYSARPGGAGAGDLYLSTCL